VNTEGATEIGQSRETDNTGYTRRRQTKQKQNTTQYALDTTMRKQRICFVKDTIVDKLKGFHWLSFGCQ
jgi:hypothetical protein